MLYVNVTVTDFFFFRSERSLIGRIGVLQRYQNFRTKSRRLRRYSVCIGRTTNKFICYSSSKQRRERTAQHNTAHTDVINVLESTVTSFDVQSLCNKLVLQFDHAISGFYRLQKPTKPGSKNVAILQYPAAAAAAAEQME